MEGSVKSKIVLWIVLISSALLVWAMCKWTDDNGWPEDIKMFKKPKQKAGPRMMAGRGFNRKRPDYSFESYDDDEEASMEFEIERNEPAATGAGTRRETFGNETPEESKEEDSLVLR